MRLTRRLAAALVAAPLALTLLVPAPSRAADDPAVQTVRDLYAAFSAALKDGPGPLPARVEAVGPALDKAFDFPAMTRIAVGSKWSSFTPEQQAAVIDAFKRSLTVTYANRLARAAGGKFDVTPKVEERGAQRVVPTRVTAADGDDSAVDFVVNADNRIQDVLLNGDVSEIAAQRNALSAPLKSGGADGVVKFLRARTDGMLAAKPTP
ncbi:phospholipid transport system substrate-binding protein [Methylobacterium sp. PvP062]|uniref:Toluene tolerance family protein n=2 Tax=Methylobacterium radiotolerans TaxID=31998 RepID=B1LZT7_METRJ|nr:MULTISPECIES: ABC transporter substrate-binding protein [Methylobacterium]MBE7247664.1 ABC transporter substrate-binding protein [Actinomycetospora chiangmaiensis]MBN6822025.1 ABC transporter substrate-binding protein [Methylobacterium organophilum]MCX7330158.1 ABC transporter substrate-binding protein [Hyphomicrobiales bacterium]GAN50604.1 toluene tolerance family protein [Methylobacterium sp. ME121]ACB22985.1 toluene tolerance family protein [Methylobacterium radiotolerans JCM 2831]